MPCEREMGPNLTVLAWWYMRVHVDRPCAVRDPNPGFGWRGAGLALEVSRVKTEVLSFMF
jgi:hypothetical protein